MKNVLIVSLSFILVLTSCSEERAKSTLPTLELTLYKHIYERNIPAIKQALLQPDEKYKLMAAKAAASILDTALLPPLRKMLLEQDIRLQSAAIFALGQYGMQEDLNTLTSLIPDAPPYFSIHGDALVACSKIYTEKNVDEFAYQQDAEASRFITIMLKMRSSDDDFYESYAEAVSNLNRKKIHYPQFIDRMRYMLLQCARETRVLIAQAIAGYPDYDLMKHREYLLNWLSSERNQDVKSFIIQALGKLNDAEINKELKAVALTGSLSSNPRMAALLALEKNKKMDSQTAEVLALDPNKKIARKAIQMATQQRLQLDLQKLSALDNSIPYVRGAWHAYKINNGVNNASSQCLAELHAQEEDIQRTFFIEALAYNSQQSDVLLELCLSHPSPIVKYAAANAIVFQVNEKKWGGSVTWLQAAQSAIQTHDTGVIDSFLSLGESDKINKDEKQALLQMALLEKDKLTLPRDIEVFNHIIDFNNLFAEKKEEHLKANQRFPINWDYFQPKSDTLKMETTKGTITIALNADIAPYTCEMFRTLVSQGFYDGKLFHRVVPNFVAQGGCPVGTGMGSLDYPIVSEFSPNAYNRGTLGIASSGTDTESCQFFVMHQYTPHLNGRYTVFGEMIEGWDVLDDLIIGDKIIKCSFEK